MRIIGYVRDPSVPALGVSHGSSKSYFFGLSSQSDFVATDALSKYLSLVPKAHHVLTTISVYFAGKHDPNPPAGSISLLRHTKWPKWSSSAENPPLLSFYDPAPLVNITSDTYRSKAIKLMIKLRKQWSMITGVGRRFPVNSILLRKALPVLFICSAETCGPFRSHGVISILAWDSEIWHGWGNYIRSHYQIVHFYKRKELVQLFMCFSWKYTQRKANTWFGTYRHRTRITNRNDFHKTCRQRLLGVVGAAAA